MTKTLKELQEEHPCIEGTLNVFNLRGPEGCSDRERALIALIAAKLEDEASIAELTKPCTCSMRTKLVGDGCDVCNPSLAIHYLREQVEDTESQLTAEQQAHAETRRQLEEAQVTLKGIAMDCRRGADLSGMSACGVNDIATRAEAFINRPADNHPTDDRGEGEK